MGLTEDMQLQDWTIQLSGASCLAIVAAALSLTAQWALVSFPPGLLYLMIQCQHTSRRLIYGQLPATMTPHLVDLETEVILIILEYVSSTTTSCR